MKKNIKTLKKKFRIYSPKIKEECGVFGISNSSDASTLTALGLHALQHRGQEGCGIVSFDGEKYHSEKRFGLVGDNFNDKMVEEGSIFYTTSDTETIVKLIAKSKRGRTIDKIIDAIFQIQGGYALVMMTQNSLIGVRDPLGIRPLVIGKLKNSYVFTSETCALDIIGAKFVREVENGEIVYVENDELQSLKPFPPKKVRPCIFEYIYFSRPDSILSGKTAYEYRKNFGAQLAKEDTFDADLVVPVPDSGNAAALGYAQEKKVKFDLGLIRNHYVGRTFIEPSQQIRSLGVKLKLNANFSVIKNKKIILIDDSLVRGTTSYKIVKMLYDAGAKEVHVRIASPEIKYPDFYGVDTPTKKELLAANKTVDEIKEFIVIIQ